MATTKRRTQPGDGKRDLEEINATIEKRLFIARVPPGTQEDEIRRVYGEFGHLLECKVVHGRGVAFVSYADWGTAHRALVSTDGIRSLAGHQGDLTLLCSFAERTKALGRGGGAHLAKGSSNSRVFVGSLPEDATDAEVRKVFGAYGDVEAVNLLPPKLNRRCCFVTFALWGEALDAIEALDNSYFRGGDNGAEPLTVVIAEPREPAHGAGAVVTTGANAEPPRKRPRTAVKEDNRQARSKWDEFEDLKAEYMKAVDGDGPSEACTELHWELMRLRALLQGSRSGANQAILGTADIVDFFERIDLQKLERVLVHYISAEFSPSAALVVTQCVRLLFRNKYFMVHGHILRKLASLSVGEQIATAAANILRHHLVLPLLDDFRGIVEHFYGFVDDTFFIFNGTSDQFAVFQERMQAIDASMVEWTFEYSKQNVHFLDLSIHTGADGKLHTSTYRKPGFVAQYLHATSLHPQSQIQSIFKAETTRYLVNTSPSLESHYDRDVRNLIQTLRARGHPQYSFVKYDGARRQDMLQKLANREPAAGANRHQVLERWTNAPASGPARTTPAGAPSDPPSAVQEDRDAARLFIGGLPHECTDDELVSLVEQVRGSFRTRDRELLECRTLPGRGCGYIRFSSWEAAEEAIEALHDRSVNGWRHPLRARWAQPKGPAGGPIPPDAAAGVGRGDVISVRSWDTGNEREASRDSRGRSRSPRRDSRVERRRGGSGVDRSTGRTTLKRNDRRHNDEGSDLEDGYGDNDQDRCRLFVGQLNRNIGKDEIQSLFERHGVVCELRVLDGKGVAYVTYSRASEARRALQALHGSSISGISRKEGLNVQVAKPR